MNIHDRLIVALDGLDFKETLTLVEELKGLVGTFKVGLGLFTHYGPEIVQEISKRDAHVFLDLKFHDIPMQVAEAVKSACSLGPRFITVHSLGGKRMLEEALKAVVEPTKLIVVSLLTSLEEEDIRGLGFKECLDKSFQNLATMSYQTGTTHFVASPLEARFIKASFGTNITIVCPGIRGTGMPCQDQRRTLSAGEAINEGADILVVGRPITRALDPKKETISILNEIESALMMRFPKDHVHEAI